MGAEARLTPEEVDGVKVIISRAHSEMTDVARGIGGQSGNLRMACTGAGTATGVQSYKNLGNGPARPWATPSTGSPGTSA